MNLLRKIFVSTLALCIINLSASEIFISVKDLSTNQTMNFHFNHDATIRDLLMTIQRNFDDYTIVPSNIIITGKLRLSDFDLDELITKSLKKEIGRSGSLLLLPRKRLPLN